MGSTATQSQLRNRVDCDKEEADSLYAMQLASASVLPMVLKAAVELDLLELMAQAGPGAAVSPSELAAQLPTTNPDAAVMLDRILRLLCTYSVLNCSLRTLADGRVERLYSLAPVCKYLTKNSDGVSMAPLLVMNHDKVFMESWYHIKEAILEGGVPFNKAYGMNAFEYPGTDPRFNKIFNNGMSDHSILTMKKILEIYKGFNGLKSLVDVGGGTGATLNMILSKYPDIKGINFDLPHVIHDALPYHGMEHIGGDMFVNVPKGDAIFMKWICHDWSDDHCLKFLKNCFKALPENGKMIIMESIIPEEPDTSPTTRNVIHADILMLAYNPGGRERTEKEFEVLSKNAGFIQFRKVCCALNTWIMEFYK
ncbi:unnamed protein product [Cuscuta epithymum]|uniref:Caffeic acid O-methyltransferase n=1 Tax=Cuscuta epithymum TaxID=186058 RepID=A0AAV0G554_9ASTE|nr:unnamed protein product [Cuscuta epithymum]